MTGVQLTPSCPAATRHLGRIVQAIHHTGDATMLQGLLPDENCPKLESSKSKNTHTMTNSVCTVSNWIVTPLWWFPIRTESVWRPQAQPVDIVHIPSHWPVEVKDLACFKALSLWYWHQQPFAPACSKETYPGSMPLATILSKDKTAPSHIFTFKCQHLATCSISAHATWYPRFLLGIWLTFQ